MSETTFEQIIHEGVVYEVTANGLVSKYNKSGWEKREPPDDEILLCVEWLEKFARPQKGINHKMGSYGLKHVVENWAGSYVSNGAFIAAAMRLEYRIEPDEPRSPNARFRMFIPAKAQRFPENKGARGNPAEDAAKECSPVNN